MRTLAEILRAHLRRRALSQAAFARTVGMSPAKISEVVHGRQRLSRRRLADASRWCEALRLEGVEAEALIDAMYVSAAEPRVREIIARLAQRVHALEGDSLELRALRVQLRRMIPDERTGQR